MLSQVVSTKTKVPNMENIEILWFALGFALGWILQARRMISKLLANPDRSIEIIKKCKQLQDKDTEAEEQSARSIRVERHGDAIYLYAKDTEEFLAQGSTLQEALAVVEKRFPDQNFRGLLSKEEAATLGITVK